MTMNSKTFSPNSVVKMMLNEKLDWIFAGKEVSEQVSRMKTVINNDVVFKNLMSMSGGVKFKISGLPEGAPENFKPENDLPDGMAHTNVRQEWRRVANFTSVGSMQNLRPSQREAQWLQLITGIHPQEAVIMTLIKDQNLQSVYSTLAEVLVGCKIDTSALVSIQPEAPKKKGVTKPKK